MLDMVKQFMDGRETARVVNKSLGEHQTAFEARYAESKRTIPLTPKELMDKAPKKLKLMVSTNRAIIFSKEGRLYVKVLRRTPVNTVRSDKGIGAGKSYNYSQLNNRGEFVAPCHVEEEVYSIYEHIRPNNSREAFIPYC